MFDPMLVDINVRAEMEICAKTSRTAKAAFNSFYILSIPSFILILEFRRIGRLADGWIASTGIDMCVGRSSTMLGCLCLIMHSYSTGTYDTMFASYLPNMFALQVSCIDSFVLA